MFGCAAFALTVTVREFWLATRARRASTGAAWPRALTGVVARNRRRYGGYIVHAGIAVLFLGVAASSSFQQVVDVRVAPGPDVRGRRATTITYARATAAVSSDPRATGAIMTLGAVLDVRKDGEHVATLRPRRNYFPSPDVRHGSVGRLIAADPTSEVALAAGPLRDVWAALTPDLALPRPDLRARERADPGRARRPDDARRSA